MKDSLNSQGKENWNSPEKEFDKSLCLLIIVYEKCLQALGPIKGLFKIW